MDIKRLKQLSEFEWQVNPASARTLPGIIYADSVLIRGMDEKVCEQVTNVTALPGLVRAVYAMPDAHWGYGFPIGGVAAFDPAQGGVISAGGVGFDIACGVRTLHTGLVPDDILAIRKQLADQIARDIPAGIGSRGKIPGSPDVSPHGLPTGSSPSTRPGPKRRSGRTTLKAKG